MKSNPLGSIPQIGKSLHVWLNGILLLLTVRVAAQEQCLNGNCLSGLGEKRYADASRFIGQFEAGNKKSGIYIYPNGDLYQGSFIANKRQGSASYQYKNGALFEGYYHDDEKQQGRLIQPDGQIYEGNWSDNKPNGFGRFTSQDGKIWEGIFENGVRKWGAFIGEPTSDTLEEKLEISHPQAEQYAGTSDAFPRVFAVVAGVANYQGSRSDLRYSDDDARAFYQYLRQAMPRETNAGKVILLLNEQASFSALQRTLKEVFALAREGDMVLFYFSGHGSQAGFIPYDLATPLTHTEVRQAFRTARASFRICIADACFSGGMNQAGAEAPFLPLANLSDARTAVIMSSKPSQASMEASQLQQGLFSYYLGKGLKGWGDLNHDSYVTAAELFLYTKNKVSQFSRGSQVPVVSGANLHRIPLARIVKP